MTLVEIAQTARPNQKFRHGTDDSLCFFDEKGILCFIDMDNEVSGFVVTKDELESKDWHYEA